MASALHEAPSSFGSGESVVALASLGVDLGALPLIGDRVPEVQPLWALTCGVGEALEQTGLLDAETEGDNLLLMTSQAAHVGAGGDSGTGGVVFGELGSVLDRLPARFRVPLAEAPDADSDPMIALQRELSAAGSAVVVGEGVSVPKPVVAVHWVGDRYRETGFAALWRSVVTLERGARATVVHLEGSRAGSEVPSLASVATELDLAEGARLTYVQIGWWEPNVRDVGAAYARLAGGASLEWIKVALAENPGSSRSHLSLEGEKAEAEAHFVVAAGGLSRWAHQVTQRHLAPQARSDVRLRAVVAGQADARFCGLVQVMRAAQHSEAYQRGDFLLLGKASSGESSPQLEIEADQVRCSHAVTVTRPDDEQAFYLMSRGLPPEEAQRLLVRGFAEKVIGRIPVRSVAAALRRHAWDILRG